jgi:predicted nucleic acid-binding protein
MTGRAFLDTNVFVYDVDTSAPPAKRSIAHDLVREALAKRRSVISYQVIQEFLNVATGKFGTTISLPDAQAYVNTVFRPLLAAHSSVQLFHEALDISGRYRISWYDSLVVAAACEGKCTVLYTEDLGDGTKINGVRIENPFRAG